jgi:uroporphyrinogen-III synthase
VGLEPTLVPTERYDSDGLLALPRLQRMAGREVIVVRGQGGRERLRRVLEARGARVAYAEIYRRRCTERSAHNLLASWSRLVQAVTVTSVEILECLWRLLGEEGRPLLRATPLVVLSERIAVRARELGCRQVRVTARAGDHAILESLCELAEEP